jgi:acyl carrier protein
MSSTIHFRLQNVFREVFDQPTLEVTPELSPASLPAWDSVAMVQIVLAAEQEFGLRFSTDEVASVKSAGDILRLISSKSG